MLNNTIDIGKLKGKIVEKGFNQSKLAIEIGLNRSTMHRKINSGEFTVEEANKIRNTLQLTNEELMEIFFNQTVS
jgi:DNA-binding XRE family transcriptional regulator